MVSHGLSPEEELGTRMGGSSLAGCGHPGSSEEKLDDPRTGLEPAGQSQR